VFKQFLTILIFLFYAATSWAAGVDVNTASAADLNSIRGIGPALSDRIIEARKQGSFKDWGDFISRVKGVGPRNATKFSSAGLTVGGASLAGSPAITAPVSIPTPASNSSAIRLNPNPTAPTVTTQKTTQPAPTTAGTSIPITLDPAATVAPAPQGVDPQPQKRRTRKAKDDQPTAVTQ
jgi:competence protein ComEA